MTETTALTIFDKLDQVEAIKAIDNLVLGKTPASEIRERDVVRGTKVKYVNTYYMCRQIALITGFRWSSECLEERLHPANPPHQEVAAKMRVTIWDRQGNKYSHDSWGCVQVQSKGVLLFDQFKAAYSDGIKKCLSYFGIANDVYGGKDLQFLGQEPVEIEDDTGDRKSFMAYLSNNHIMPSKACKILEVNDLSEITNWQDAIQKLEEAK